MGFNTLSREGGAYILTGESSVCHCRIVKVPHPIAVALPLTSALVPSSATQPLSAGLEGCLLLGTFLPSLLSGAKPVAYWLF